MATMIVILSIFAMVLLVLTALLHSGWGTVICLMLSWLVGYGFPAPIQARILKETADAPNFASTLISTAFNLGIAIAAALGAAVINAGWGYASLPLIAAASELTALILVTMLAILERLPGRAVTAA
jgi:DHA1 family inner membrane transport protein